MRKSYEFLAAASCRGRRTVKVIRLSALAARIVPPWRARISLAMAKPRPAPPVRVARELSSRKNWSKMRSSFYAGMVRPSLVNVRTTVSASCCPVIRTVDPGKL